MATAERTIAVSRWKILRKAILDASSRSQGECAKDKGKTDGTARASARSFSSFELFSVTDIDDDGEEGGEEASTLHSSHHTATGFVWKRYSHRRTTSDAGNKTDDGNDEDDGTAMNAHLGASRDTISAFISHLPPSTSLEAMTGFNNTGNVCVWPSEQVLAHYCLENRHRFRGKSVCELGGGMTCLAGVMLALTGLPARVELTDGNESSVENVRRIVGANGHRFNGVCVSVDVLLWSEAFLATERDEVDFVVCADCLFFVELHQCLCQVIHKLLSPGGRALLFNPGRSGSLDRFVEVAERMFSVSRVERYSETVWARHCAALANDRYKFDLHYPLLLILKPLQLSSATARYSTAS